MMETAESGQRDQLCSGRFRLDLTAVRGVFVESIVGAVRVIVGHVLSGDAADVRFIDRDHVVGRPNRETRDSPRVSTR